MPYINEIIKKIEEFAPTQLAEEWDNSGWQVFLGDREIKKIMLALSPSLDVIDQAVNKGCELVITHHPLIFSPLKTLNREDTVSSVIVKAIQNNVQLYSAHTNLDKAKNGTSKTLAELIGMKNLSVGHDFIVYGSLEDSKELKDFLDKVKKILKSDNLKLINNAGIKTVRNIAVCAGSGADLAGTIKGADLFITGDVKYHTAVEITDFAIVDAGHFETERIILPVLKELLCCNGAEAFIADEKFPWEIV